MSSPANNAPDGRRRPHGLRAARRDPSAQFYFGARRYATSGPRRLFVPQQALTAPVFDQESDRQRVILRYRQGQR